jgi:endonuclease/exonuclease/phosphatase family metal-dependent hydrolase
MNRRVVFHRVSGIPARQSARRIAVAVAVLSFVITSLHSAVALAQSPPAPPSRFHIVGEEPPPPISSGPSTPREIPGTIEAELFDSGANGSAYWDSSAGNSGHQYRSTDVDIEGCNEGGYNVGWTTPGEWLGYTVSVAAAGTYNFDFRVASVGGGTLHVEFNGDDKTGGVGVPSTGGWQTWTTVRKTVTLNAGTQSMRVVFDTGNVNLHLISVWLAPGSDPPPPPPPPSGGGGRLRVATWNIDFGGGNLAAQAHEIVNSGADVVLLQEASTFEEYMPTTYADRLRQLTGQTWYHVWAPAEPCPNACQGFLILSKLPIVSSASATFAGAATARAMINVGGVNVNLFGLHLEYYDTNKRTAQLLQIMDWARQFSAPRIVGGDFNSWWGEWWIAQMESEYTDTWQDVTGSDLNGYTLNGSVRFDYLFRSRDQASRLTPTACWVQSTGLSDHSLVIADYQVR